MEGTGRVCLLDLLSLALEILAHGAPSKSSLLASRDEMVIAELHDPLSEDREAERSRVPRTLERTVDSLAMEPRC